MLHNHSACVDVLKAAGAATHMDIFTLAATLIQAVYRGHKLVNIYSNNSLNPLNPFVVLGPVS